MTGAERGRFAEWRSAMGVLPLGRRRVAGIDALREFAGFDVGFEMIVDRPGDDLVLDTDMTIGASRLFVAEVERFYGDGRTAALFSVDAPQVRQRNQLVALGSASRMATLAPATYQRLGFTAATYRTWCEEIGRVMPTWQRAGLYHHHQYRYLICEGPALLGLVNAMHGEPARPSQLAWLRRLLPTLRQRLVVERRLAAAIRDAGMLQASLDTLPWPAFVTGGAGQVRTANVAGTAALGDRAVRELMRAASRGEVAGARVTELVEGEVRWRLVELPQLRGPIGLQVAAGRFGLSQRQRAVLEQVLAGRSHRAVAIALGISARTVEAHVAASLGKLGVRSVAEAVVLLAGRR